jgi:peptidyl-dipeptidase A
MRTSGAVALVLVLGASTAVRAQTAAEAKAFVDDADARLLKAAIEAARADWVKSTFITDDTEYLAGVANQRLSSMQAELAKAATKFDKVEVADDVRRRLLMLKLAIVLPVPSEAAEAEELAQLVASMEGTYGKGKYCKKDAAGAETCQDIGALSQILAESRDEGALREAWTGWHTISRPIRKEYQRYVELGNKGARELGFADMGAQWRAKYDMPPDEFAKEVDRLYEQVRPLYASLHAYVRRKLREQYGASVVPEKGPIPAHLLGNMWAQEWPNLYPLVAPAGADPGIDLTARLKEKGYDAKKMVKSGEGFFSSLGFAPLPETFWERSLFTKPQDHDVVCHASAWNIDQVDDLRIKMCIETTGEDFRTIHHELGHNYYQRAYNRQPFLFRDSANEGFHEAIGDTVALSVTPAYLKQIGLIDAEPDASKDIGLLLHMALDKVAFVPFGLLIDQWRWKVFSGEITPANYNAEWWRLKEKYQGVSAPVARTEDDFDPGAKYHVPANVSYTRYFLAHVLQFQFHRGLCKAAGYTGPLNRCSIYGNQEAGARLQKTLEMGMSRPWPDAMEALTGERKMDATAMLDYFAPLQKWLDEQNKGQTVGWSGAAPAKGKKK